MQDSEYSPEIESAIELRDALLAVADWYGELSRNALSLRECLAGHDRTRPPGDYYVSVLESQDCKSVLPTDCQEKLEYLEDSWGLFSEEYLRLRKAHEDFSFELMDNLDLPLGSRWSTRLVHYVNEVGKPLREILNLLDEQDPDETAHPVTGNSGFDLLVGRILVGNFPQGNWKDLFDRIIGNIDDLEAVIANRYAMLPRPVDGPVGGYRWRHNGEVSEDSMRRTAWKLASLLYEKMPDMVDFRDLAEPVFGDREEPVDRNQVGTHRKFANKFFEDHGVPFRVRTSEQKAYMELLS